MSIENTLVKSFILKSLYKKEIYPNKIIVVNNTINIDFKLPKNKHYAPAGIDNYCEVLKDKILIELKKGLTLTGVSGCLTSEDDSRYSCYKLVIEYKNI
jgi:hypothetical protein